MALLLTQSQKNEPEKIIRLPKALITVGTENRHDIQLPSESPGTLFTLIQNPDGWSVMPAQLEILLNGKPVSKNAPLKSCDRLSWKNAAVVFLQTDYLSSQAKKNHQMEAPLPAFDILQKIAATLKLSGSVYIAMNELLDHLIEISGAEVGHLLAELPGRPGWELLSSRRSENSDPAPRQLKKELISNSILREAIQKREPVFIESIIGHPMANAVSVIDTKIFSVACFPLCLEEQILGAVFLHTQKPGHSIRKDQLTGISILATQAALLLATQTSLRLLQQENRKLKTSTAQEAPSLIYETQPPDNPMIALVNKLPKVSTSPLNVLLIGETGTGKELIAREIHRLSQRAQKPFVAINCAAIPETLLESILFGHEKGAFTGAVRAQEGKFQAADGGTIFLDEIGDLPVELQTKLLRTIQEKVIEPLGSHSPRTIDVRIIAATHHDLDRETKTGKFRDDLYFRLNGVTLQIPPLRSRKTDILPLAREFIRRTGISSTLSEDAVKTLEEHSWPGNVRELEQVIQRAVFLSDGPRITAKDLELKTSDAATEGVGSIFRLDHFLENPDLKKAQLEFTRKYVESILKECEGRREVAAQRLGVSERTLYRILPADEDSQ